MNLPGQHASNTSPWAPGDQETNRGVRHRIPSSAHKQNDGGIEWVQLEIKKRRREIIWVKYTGITEVTGTKAERLECFGPQPFNKTLQ